MTRTTEKDEPELVEPVIVPGGTVRPADGAFQEPEATVGTGIEMGEFRIWRNS